MLANQTTYTTSENNFDKIYDEVISTREGSESVSVIPTAELNSIMETVYSNREGG